MILHESVRPSSGNLDPQVRRRQRAAQCQVSISTCSATRSAWKRCSARFGSKPRADQETNSTVLAPSTAQRRQAAERSRSTLPTGGTTAASATVGATNWNLGRRSTSSRCTMLPWTDAASWLVKSPGFIAGDDPPLRRPLPRSEQEKRHRYFEPSGNVTLPNNVKHLDWPSKKKYLARLRRILHLHQTQQPPAAGRPGRHQLPLREMRHRKAVVRGHLIGLGR